MRGSAGRSKAADAPPKNDPLRVGRALLCEVIASHPVHLTVDQLVGRAVADSPANMEMASAYYAIRDLRRTGLFHYGAEEIVEPTQAALHAHALLTTHD